MTDHLDPGVPSAEQASLERRRSKNPLRNMMQHLTVDSPSGSDDGAMSRRRSLIRRLSGQKSRSPSAHSDAASHPSISRPSSRPPSAVGINRDPALCESCASLVVDIEDTLDDVDFTFAKAVNPGAADDFEKREHFLARLKGLEENQWASTCPLCRLFWAVRVPSNGPGGYSLLGLSSRDTSYLVDSAKMYDLGHPAKGKAKGLSPGFLSVISRTQVPGGRTPDVDPDWFRESGMLLRTRPGIVADSVRERADPDGRLAVPEPASPSPSPCSSDDGSWHRKGIWGREIGQNVDMSVGREWLQFCKTHHQGRCSRRPVSARLHRFQLIDCALKHPRLVERPLAEDYVALSYVRGEHTEELMKELMDEASWPQVVRDATVVTRQLGVRYLWVDYICINIDWTDDHMIHSMRMNEIYEGAVVTIIAACGGDMMHGLTGIGSTTRPAQPKYKLTTSNITLVSSLQDPRLLVKQSTWFTRGWTYQEGLLARRRLIFTEQQMYWECGGMACPETLDLPLEFYHDAEERRMCDFVRPGLFNGVSYMDGSWEQWRKLPQKDGETSTLSIFREVDQHIVNATRREITDEEDSWIAFFGIFRQLEDTLGRGKLSILAGIPIWAPVVSDTPTSEAGPGPPRSRHLFALSTAFWHHKDGVQAQRRRYIPSWSWIGWTGAVELFSSVVIAADPDGKTRGRKVLNHHYVSATQLTRNEPSSVQWTYSPEIEVLDQFESVAYDFGATDRMPRGSPDGPPKGPPCFSMDEYRLRVTNPLVLDRVKARTHADGWMFNDLSVDVRMSRGSGGTEAGAQPGTSSLGEYIQRHASGEDISVLWFVEETTVMLLVLERHYNLWERVGRMRMAFPEDAKDVMKACGRLEGLLDRLPLRRLGEDIIIA